MFLSVFRSVFVSLFVSRFLSFSIRSDVCGVSISTVKLVTTGTCASNGYTRITDGDMCKAAAKAAGFVPTWYSFKPGRCNSVNGCHKYRGRVNGCSIKVHSDEVYLSTRCNKRIDVSSGQKNYCDCRYDPCLCDARDSMFRETTCTDKPLGWTDIGGDTCATYKSSKWCKPDGSSGTGWAASSGRFSDYANSAGVDASEACCACGAGVKMYEIIRVACAA